ncbi:MAG: hypothetical protein ACR2Q3_19655 [Woeseiaceae bacterium]
MPDVPKCWVHKCGIAVIAAVLGTALFAQEATEEAEETVTDVVEIQEIAAPTEVDAAADDVVEEIVVFGSRPGDRRRVDVEYEDPVRAQLLKDFHKMRQDEEEYEWRKSAAAESSSRIKWGYDPRDDYRMRNEMNLQELPSERNKPATLFRFEF